MDVARGARDTPHGGRDRSSRSAGHHRSAHDPDAGLDIPHARFELGQLFLAMEFIGVQSIFIIALTGTFSGMVLALQMVHSFKQFQAEGLVGGVVALSLSREISPVFTGLMVTARAGSAWAAELGNMRVTEQIDAITRWA